MKTFADNNEILLSFTAVIGVVLMLSLATISHYYANTAEFNYCV